VYLYYEILHVHASWASKVSSKKINNLYNIASVKSWKLYSVATEIENATTISMVCWEIKGLPFSIGGI